MATPEDDVREFMTKFGCPIGLSPHWPPDDLLQFRLNFVGEEVGELTVAIVDRDLPGVADALADLVYVAIGMAVTMGIPFQRVWDEVHRKNMEKERALPDGSNSRRFSAYDVVKPEGWTPPDVREILRKAGA